jgi:hypothetical protein
MAEYTATFRLNYFAVKDPDKFRAFCESFDLEMIMKTEEGIPLYGFLNKGNESGIPFARYDQKADDWELVDLIGILAEHLMPDYVAVIIELGYEEMRYLVGEAYAVNSRGETAVLNPNEIYQRAGKLGKICNPCSY